MTDPDDTLPPSERDTIPAPPMIEGPVVVTLFPSVLQAPPPDESGEYASLGKRFDAAAFASESLDDES